MVLFRRDLKHETDAEHVGEGLAKFLRECALLVFPLSDIRLDLGQIGDPRRPTGDKNQPSERLSPYSGASSGGRGSSAPPSTGCPPQPLPPGGPVRLRRSPRVRRVLLRFREIISDHVRHSRVPHLLVFDKPHHVRGAILGHADIVLTRVGLLLEQSLLVESRQGPVSVFQAAGLSVLTSGAASGDHFSKRAVASIHPNDQRSETLPRDLCYRLLRRLGEPAHQPLHLLGGPWPLRWEPDFDTMQSTMLAVSDARCLGKRLRVGMPYTHASRTHK